MTDWGSLVRASLIGLEPYRPGASLEELRAAYGLDEIVKLNWNEGLHGPFPGVAEAVEEELARVWIYPEQAYSDLRESVAGWVGTSPERIVPGHGIQALIATVAHAFLEPGDAVVVTDPTYGLYAQASAAAGARVVSVPSRGFRHDADALAAAASEAGARLVWLCDPNNPTGSLVQPAVLDVGHGRPILLLRTFSKIFGLAGLRLGYAVVGEALAGFLDVVQEPFNVNRAALAAGRASLRSPELVDERRRSNERARDRLAALLAAAGCEPTPSQANFLLVGVGVDDLMLTDGLARRGLLVRAGSEFGLQGYVRITTGPEPLMERAAAELADVRAQLGEPEALER